MPGLPLGRGGTRVAVRMGRRTGLGDAAQGRRPVRCGRHRIPGHAHPRTHPRAHELPGHRPGRGSGRAHGHGLGRLRLRGRSGAAGSARIGGRARQGKWSPRARRLYASALGVFELPDYLRIWPGHGAGSACGKALGAVPDTTAGYGEALQPRVGGGAERRGRPSSSTSWTVSPLNPPLYFGRMKEQNRRGPLRARAASPAPEAVRGGASRHRRRRGIGGGGHPCRPSRLLRGPYPRLDLRPAEQVGSRR